MALTAKQKKQLNMRIDELVRNNVDQDALDTYRMNLAADDNFALSEIADYAARQMPFWTQQITLCDAQKADYTKKINLFT